jgi:hypothetical protein
MQLIIFPLFLVWAALTAGCAYPFNDNRLLNTTVLAEFIANATDRGGDNWVTVTDPTGPKTAWPKTGSDGLVSIPYCYESWADENALKNQLDDAWAMWSTKLGLPNAGNGHSLARFHEAIQSGGDDNSYCYVQNGQNWDWNPKMPWGTLIIRAE